MPQKWEQGNAAMQPAYDESAVQNPFTPIDYAARLQSSPRKPRQEQRYMPPVPSAPPMPAPGYEPPQYMQIPAQGYPAQNAAGAPYSAALFEHQPTAVMPSGWEQTPFADRTAIEFWKEQPVQQPVWQQPEPEAEPEPEPGPVYYSAADIPLRDPFTPAKPREDAEKQPEEARQPKQEKKRSGRSRIRVGRLLALIAACVMLLVCALAGGQMLAELVRSERENKEHEANGTQLYAGAIEVELPPAGETFAPEFLPPTATPAAAPVLPVSAVVPETDDAEEDASAVKRSRLTSYPKNPMRNITESLRGLVEENADTVGRLVINGLVDEMVMQRNNTYYLTHNASGATSESGAVFADQSCVLRNPPENLLLRGQSGVPGKVFAPLWQFVSGGQSFASSNLYAKFTSLYEEETYVLFAILVVDINPAGSRYFNYASNPSFTTDEAMMQYVESARSRSIYQFGVDVTPSDRLLTLSTLGSGDSNLVLMYRMLRENETPVY